jgi:hypothetical protein
MVIERNDDMAEKERERERERESESVNGSKLFKKVVPEMKESVSITWRKREREGLTKKD